MRQLNASSEYALAMQTGPIHILLLEDDPAIAKTVIYALERAGLKVTHCLLVGDALRQIDTVQYDVLVLDVGLPDGSGLDVCRAVRQHPQRQHVPILMLSAHGEEIDRVLGLELGADDYVTKPFSPRELLARVRGLARRALTAQTAVNTLPTTQHARHPGLSEFDIDTEGQRAHLHGQPLPLTRREFGLLVELMRHPGRICSRDNLLDRVWGNDSDSTDRTVDTHIKTLRAKLQKVSPERDYIETHRGMGYAMAWPNHPAQGTG